MKRSGVAALLLAIQLLAGSAVAADKLQVDLIPQTLRARSGASIPVEARFRWNGTRILEGRLEVELREGNQILERYRSGDLALTTGEQTFRMLLPPPLAPFSDAQVEAHMKFVTAHETFDLDYSLLTMPIFGERSLAVGWCKSRNGADTQASGFEQSLLFERYAPSADDAARKLLMTSVVRLTPEDLPLQPLDYTAFDVVVLAADGFAEAHESQLHALARWVKGGGSVCVFVGGGLQTHHLSFLNELVESSQNEPAFLADSAGNLLPGHEKLSCFHTGVGRSVIVTGSSAPDSSEWRRAVAFLWKFRVSQEQTIVETGHWQTATNASDENGNIAPPPQSFYGGTRIRPGRRASGVNYGGMGAYSVQQTSIGAELMEQLMPKTVRLIPFGALVVMLGLFLLMIGPVDYFVLGWLRRRRFTWALFPATSIAFMLATVAMANYFLGRHDQRRSLTVVDVGADGAALRWNRYELVFAARDIQAVTELKDALWTPVDSGQGWTSYNPISGYRDMDTLHETGPPWYEGAVPVHFRTSQSIHQWRPVLNRVFSFEPPPVPLPAGWRAVEQAWPNLTDIRAKLSAGKPFGGDVCMVSGTEPIKLDGQSSGLMSRSILEALCRAGSSGLFSLVSQISPTGGQNFEDVQSDGSVLAIVTKTGDDIVVYRRFFHGD